MKHRSLLLLAFAFSVGCSSVRPLMPTPNLYTDDRRPIIEQLDTSLQTHRVQVLYLTDRAPEATDGSEVGYGFGRSASLAFGTATVQLGHGLSWEELLRFSSVSDRTEDVELSLVAIDELGRYPETPYGFAMRDDQVVLDPEDLADAEAAEAALRAEVERRLALTPRKEAYVFVHGYANTFAEGAFKMAEGWHFLGREGLPVLYSWAAGHGGLTGYAYDRESGEFTIFHLKQMLRALAAIPELDAIHVVSHSRGTDVAATALRELVIETRAAGLDTREEFKIANLVLAAPDLDMQVVEQRLIAEGVGLGVERVTIYTSQGDKAIRLAEKLRSGLRRLGRVDVDDLPQQRAEEIEALQKATHIDFIDFEGKADRFGHSYFSTNPAASSDFILLLRDGRAPGAENGRPLTHLGASFWRIEEGYPYHHQHPSDPES